MPRKIAIVGGAVTSRDLAPFNDLDWEIWACSNTNYGLLPRVDVWLEIHSVYRKMAQAPEFMEMLRKHSRVYMQDHYPDFPGSIAYPQEIRDKWGPDVLTSSIAYLMALAMEGKPDVIGLFGVDMSTNFEYGPQRPGMKFLIREADKMGIKVIVPPQADLLRPTPWYGYKENWPAYIRIQARKDYLAQRQKVIEEQIRTLEREHDVNVGAIETEKYAELCYIHDPVVQLTRERKEVPDENAVELPA